MAIALDGIDLPDLIWEAQLDWTGVAASSEVTLGGRPVVWEAAVQRGRPIDLVALDDQGWLTKAQVQALKQKASTPGWIGVLEYEGETYRVRFRHEDGAIEVSPIVPRPNAEDGDWYTGRIRLMEV